MSPDPTAQIPALRIDPTYSPRETALLLGRSYSWLDQRLRAGQFMLPDGTKVEPRRTAGGYRRFTLAMLEDIALSSYRHGWFSMDKLKSIGVAANPDRQCPKLDPRPKRLPPHPTATGRTDARRMGLVRRMVSGT
jgi:hypothetical protein